MSKLKSTDELKEILLKVHGDRYDYSELDYKGRTKLIKIGCKLHGFFTQTASNHLQGKGCATCAGISRGINRKLNEEDVIKEMSIKHNNIYDYSKFRYTKSTDKSVIICKLHGEFLQSHNIHRKGVGCPSCGLEIARAKISKTTEDLIKSSDILFNGKFIFDKSEYICRFCEIIITCPQHGDFKTAQGNHLTSKHGCEKCANACMGENAPGWSYSKWGQSGKTSDNFDSFKVYIIRCWNEEEEFFKIGKTYTTIKLRYGRKKEMPYNFEVCKTISSNDYKFICELEEKLKKDSKDNKYLPIIPFGGRNECFSKIN